MKTLKTRGIVLKRRVFGEADRILTIFTPGYGKIEAIAKGSRRLSSKLGGHVELYYLVDWILAEGRTWQIVTSADTVQDFPELRRNLETVKQASHVAHLVQRLLPEGEPHREVYQLLEATLGAIRPGSSPLILRQFEWQLLGATGSQPQLDVCSHCASVLDPTQLGLCPARGGALCPNCLATEAVHIPASAESVKVLRLFAKATSLLADRLNLSNETLPELERITRAFLEHVLEASLLLTPQNDQITSTNFQTIPKIELPMIETTS